ncbi:hypothetical protein J3R30DRAFT_731536 [Lentinula aciculospora]|uniref:Uncharacterized protein n=1 Tax=Lentinula aciculospora TaxID=153920 RepID=A0A9W9A4G4_9AGAR|nr:hypothetical protein J3R30DRAFT_731536 [Lentinula aciculospora]
MSPITLPPGFYEIHTHTDGGETKVLTPESFGIAIATGTASRSAAWQISSDGLIVAFDKSGTEYQTLTNNKPCINGEEVTTEKEGGMRWIIYGVEHHLGNFWTGSIMTCDGTKLFWNVDSYDKVRLEYFKDVCIQNIPLFHFIPVGPSDGKPLNQLPGNKFRFENPPMGIGILETIITLIILNLYIILEMSRGNHAGKLTELLPPWLRK